MVFKHALEKSTANLPGTTGSKNFFDIQRLLGVKDVYNGGYLIPLIRVPVAGALHSPNNYTTTTTSGDTEVYRHRNVTPLIFGHRRLEVAVEVEVVDALVARSLGNLAFLHKAFVEASDLLHKIAVAAVAVATAEALAGVEVVAAVVLRKTHQSCLEQQHSQALVVAGNFAELGEEQHTLVLQLCLLDRPLAAATYLSM